MEKENFFFIGGFFCGMTSSGSARAGVSVLNASRGGGADAEVSLSLNENESEVLVWSSVF